MAYGLLVQFAVEERSDAELRDLTGFLASIGLPISLHDLTAEPSEKRIRTIAERTLSAPHVANTPRAEPLNVADLTNAIRRVEQIARW